MDRFTSKDFKIKMVNENYFREYYDSIYNQLISENLIKDSSTIGKSKLIFRIGIISILTPGIWRIFDGAASDMLITLVITEIIIILFITLVSLYPYLKGRLTNEGTASKEAYENYHMEIAKSSNENGRDDYRDEFLIKNSWMYFLGVISIATNRSKIYIDD